MAKSGLLVCRTSICPCGALYAVLSNEVLGITVVLSADFREIYRWEGLAIQTAYICCPECKEFCGVWA